MKVCPYLREWLITSCAFGNGGFVIDSNIVQKCCKNEYYRKCPFNNEVGDFQGTAKKQRERNLLIKPCSPPDNLPLSADRHY
jgi:hypothetical protein